MCTLWEPWGEVSGNNRHYERYKNSSINFVENVWLELLVLWPAHFLRNQEGFVAQRLLSGWQTHELALPHPALQLPELSLTIFCISDVWPSVSSLVLDLTEGILEIPFSEAVCLLFSSLFIKPAFKRFVQKKKKGQEAYLGYFLLTATWSYILYTLIHQFENLFTYYKAKTHLFQRPSHRLENFCWPALPQPLHIGMKIKKK